MNKFIKIIQDTLVMGIDSMNIQNIIEKTSLPSEVVKKTITEIKQNRSLAQVIDRIVTNIVMNLRLDILDASGNKSDVVNRRKINNNRRNLRRKVGLSKVSKGMNRLSKRNIAKRLKSKREK